MILNANIFKKAADIYRHELKAVVELIIHCYPIVKQDSTFQYDEDTIRNIFVKSIRNNKSKYDLGYLLFEVETGEVDPNNQIIGYIDIKVVNVGNRDLADEDEYLCFECKRLDGKSKLTNRYVTEGIYRYVSDKYSSKMPLAGMIGFIEGGNPEAIIKKVNEVLKKSKNIATIMYLENDKTLLDSKCLYKSTHKRSSSNIDIFHLMFDFSNN